MIQSILVSAVAVAGLWAAGPLLPASPLAEQAPTVAQPPVAACAPQSAAQAPVQAVAAPAPSQAGSGPLDANTATAEQFDALPLRAITPEVAGAIVAKRTELGGRFAAVSDIFAVPGVGPATEARLPALVHV